MKTIEVSKFNENNHGDKPKTTSTAKSDLMKNLQR